MKKLVTMIVLSTVSVAICATDSVIKYQIMHSYRIFDNPDFQESEMDGALEMCDYDTNRFA